MKVILPKSPFLTFVFLIANLLIASVAFGQATVTTDKDDYAPGEYVIITGSGWLPGETVSLHLDETPKPVTCLNPHNLTAIADEKGNIYNNLFLIRESHLGVAFLLTATGQTSGLIASHNFTDANVKFEASGLSNGTAVQVTASYTNESGSFVSNQVIVFNSPGPSTAIPVFKNTIVTYTFSAVSGFIPPSANSTFTQPDNNGASTITGVYVGCATSTITGQPNNVTIVYGANAIFTVAASGTTPLTYQWQEQVGGTGAFINITNAGIYSGTTTSTLTLTKPSVAMSSNKYRCVITNVCGSGINSDNAVLMVTKATPTATLAVNNSPVIYSGSGQSATVDITTSSVSGTVSNVLTGGLATQTNAGIYVVTASFVPTDTANYNTLAGLSAGNFVIGKATPTISVSGTQIFTYNGSAQGPSAVSYNGDGTTSLLYTNTSGTAYSSATAPTNAGSYQVVASATAGTNFNAASSSPYTFTIGKAQLTVVADNKSKYCGQSNPEFTYTVIGFVNNENKSVLDVPPTLKLSEDGSTIIVSGCSDNNYKVTYVNGFLTIQGVNIDASAVSYAIPLNSAKAQLKATVKSTPSGNSVNNVNVTFKIIDGMNQTVAFGSALTGNGYEDGVARLDLSIDSLPIGQLPIGLYKVVATSGTDCTSSTFYITIYDPNGSFITGGGWINSPAGAYVADPLLTGKANFGFNAKYKKGNNQVDGNTEFQFQAGNFNFKSNLLNDGTLVISGAKATYRGVGTVNGSGNYGFMVSAIDGDMTGGGGADKFRIKIWNIANGNKVVYDNQLNVAENVDATTVLGGGSIVIHEVKKNTSKIAEKESIATPEVLQFNVIAYPNPSNYQFSLAVTSDSNEKVEVLVYNMSARLVKRIEKSNQKTILFGEDLPAGEYLVLVRQGENQKGINVIKK